MRGDLTTYGLTTLGPYQCWKGDISTINGFWDTRGGPNSDQIPCCNTFNGGNYYASDTYASTLYSTTESSSTPKSSAQVKSKV